MYVNDFPHAHARSFIRKICNPKTEEYDGMPTSGNVRRSDHASPWSPGQTSTNHTINGTLFPPNSTRTGAVSVTTGRGTARAVSLTRTES